MKSTFQKESDEKQDSHWNSHFVPAALFSQFDDAELPLPFWMFEQSRLAG